jgi:hypothetical protein
MIVPALICGMLLMTGCKKQINGFDNIIGCWTNPMYADNAEGKSIVIYEKSNALLENSEGIKFLKDGTLIERKIAGWCATPPVAYDNYSGKWTIQNDDEMKIVVTYWGGVEHKIWKIIDVTNSSLKIEILS